MLCQRVVDESKDETDRSKEYGFTTSMSPEEKLDYIEAANTILMIIIPDSNYFEYSRKLGWNYRRIAELYTMMDQEDKAIEYLLKAEKMATYYDSLDKEKVYKFTSPFCNHITSDMNRSGKYFTGTENKMLSYRLDELKDYFQHLSDPRLLMKLSTSPSILLHQRASI